MKLYLHTIIGRDGNHLLVHIAFCLLFSMKVATRCKQDKLLDEALDCESIIIFPNWGFDLIIWVLLWLH